MNIKELAEKHYPGDRLAQQAFEIGYLEAEIRALQQENGILVDELKQLEKETE